MAQRYIVFLNDRTIIIDEDINMPAAQPNEMRVKFTNKAALIKAYRLFYSDHQSSVLRIIAVGNFSEIREIFNRMFTTIVAAGGIVQNAKNEYLFIKRLGMWDLPKGKLKKNESVTDGALREVSEETGLQKLNINHELPSTFHIYTSKKGKEILKVTHWFEMSCKHDQELIPQLEEDITEVKWFALNDLQIPLANTYASIKLLLTDYLSPKHI